MSIREFAASGRFSSARLLLCAACALAPLLAGAQNDRPFAAPVAAPPAGAPSNTQLASPAIEARIDALLRQMTLEEKLGQLVQYGDTGDSANAALASDNQAPGKNPETHIKIDPMQLASTGRLGSMLNVVGAARTNTFQHAAVEKSRLHIPLLFGADILHGYRTVYPIPLGLAATFDPDLVAPSRASPRRRPRPRACAGSIPHGRYLPRPALGPHPEGAGEDAYLGAAMARAYIHGYQGDDSHAPDSVAASVKHFAAYGAAEAGREYNTTDMSLSRLHQDYLPPYRAAVNAGAATIMSAFNALNGVPSTANPYLLNDVLRTEWGFNGFVVSDYTAVMELRNHGIALDAATATRKSLLAGVDIDMMSHYYDTQLPDLIHSGKVPMSAVDEAVRRVLRVKFAMGLFEHPYATGTEVTAAVPEHRSLVRKAAEESFVLLQNKAADNATPILPLTRAPHKIALIGPLADNTQEMLARGAATTACPTSSRSKMLSNQREAGGRLRHLRARSRHRLHLDGKLRRCRRRGPAVRPRHPGPGRVQFHERRGRLALSLDLPGNQQQLLEAVAATGKPVVLLVFSGRPLVLNWAAAHVPAILETWFPGSEAGSAIANILYGDVSPSGKLPMSFPRAVGQEPLYYNQFPTGRPPVNADLTQPPGGDSRFISRYIDVPNDALFPFGYGLSYTQFSYSGISLSRTSLPIQEAARPSAARLVTATATVRNTGSRAATEVVQCYVRNLGASLEQPVRSLQGFTRVTLQPGQSKQVSFDLGFPELSFYNNAGAAVIEPTHYTVWIGGSSLATDHADFDIKPLALCEAISSGTTLNLPHRPPALERTPRANRGPLSAPVEVRLVGDMLHPIHHLAVQLLLDSDVRHGSRRSGAVPVFVTRRKPHHVPRMHLLASARLESAPSPLPPSQSTSGPVDAYATPSGLQARTSRWHPARTQAPAPGTADPLSPFP